jgi:hypothetical protein
MSTVDMKLQRHIQGSGVSSTELPAKNILSSLEC